ncbi:MAG: Alcohol dehydrogenase GroES domain protein, partial [Mucilaginibacter sp.]|nr:Alcohol dehydrogenase GroES domain protein [Mucilaginibacter sp.]
MPPPHIVPDLVDQVDRATDIGVDNPPCLSKILVQERMAETAPGIRQKGVDLTTLRGGIQLVYTFGRRKIGLKGFDFGAGVTKGSRRLLDLRFVRRDQKVVPFLAQRFANSNPMPVDAPVTIAKGRVADKPSLLWCYSSNPNPCFPLSFRGTKEPISLPEFVRTQFAVRRFRMKALTWHGKNDIRCDTVPDPKIQDGPDAIIKVTACAICGSDLHLFDGVMPSMEKGDVLGHETMGEVVEVGSENKKLKVGDRVVVPFTISCGECFFCKKGFFSGCERSNPNHKMAEKLWGHSPAGLFGYSHMLGGYAGGQAEYLRVPYADVGPIKVPQGLSDEQVLFLSDI